MASFFAHLGSAFAFAVRCSAKTAKQIIFDAGARENMRPEDVCAATAKSGRALLHDLVGFALVHGVRERVSSQGEVFENRAGELRTVGRDTAGENELADAPVVVAIGFRDRFHHAW